jgi:RND superfamily putative drug exporter
MTSLNIAGRAGRWSAEHWKTALSGWLAFVALALAMAHFVGIAKQTDADSATGGSATAQRILDRAGFQMPASETVLVQSKTLTASAPAFRSAVDDVVAALERQPAAYEIRSPLANRTQISKDGRSALVQYEIRGRMQDSPDKIQPILETVADVQARHPSLYVADFGMASAMHAVDGTLATDFHRAEVFSLPLTLLILLVAFGSVVASGIPVLLGFSGVLAATGIATLASHLVPAADPTKSVILLIGMAVGVDYSLFSIRRAREERQKGLSSRDALLAAASTSGQAVLISGLTVMIAMAGMLFTGSEVFTSIAVGSMIMVAVALVGSLTVLPAVMTWTGDKLHRSRIPGLRRRLDRHQDARAWSWVLDRVLRRPAISAALGAAALVACCVPALTLHTQLPSFTDLPRSFSIVGTYERIQHAFPGAQTPAQVVIEADDVTAPSVRQGIAALERRALATGQMSEPIDLRINGSHTVATVSIPLQGDGNDATAQRALQTLRSSVIPATIGKTAGATVAVTGQTAGTADFNQTMKSHAPLVFGFVLLLVFLLLLATFRSIVVPVKAVVLNLLSVGAAYGILVAVFQHRWAEGVLGFHSNGAIASWLPLFLFVILFGLSMDYHVFILSRVKELVDGGMDTGRAVEEGIKRTAGVVTTAAAVMVAVFAIFATLHTLDMKQMGFGLAVAVLIDATLIRAVLLPATMKLLGDWNWYLPRWLDWLPQLQHERHEPVGDREPLEPALELSA